MAEAGLSRRLVQKLAPKLDFWHRIENQVELGTPDVTYCNWGHGGWVELKHVSKYPAREATPIRFKRFTLEQVACIEAFGKGQHYSWLLVQVGADHYLFHWKVVRELQKCQPRRWWEENAYKIWTRRLDYHQLANIL